MRKKLLKINAVHCSISLYPRTNHHSVMDFIDFDFMCERRGGRIRDTNYSYLNHRLCKYLLVNFQDSVLDLFIRETK